MYCKIKTTNMTLNQFIENLTSLRDHYNAGEFEVITRNINFDGTTTAVPLDGDCFWLNLIQNKCFIDGFENNEPITGEYSLENLVNQF